MEVKEIKRGHNWGWGRLLRTVHACAAGVWVKHIWIGGYIYEVGGDRKVENDCQIQFNNDVGRNLEAGIFPAMNLISYTP